MVRLRKNCTVGFPSLSVPICSGPSSKSLHLWGQPGFLVHGGSGRLPEVLRGGPPVLPGPSVSLRLTVPFQVDLQKGLSEFSVSQRRLVHGWNEFVTDSAEPVWKKYLDQVGVVVCINSCQPESVG